MDEIINRVIGVAFGILVAVVFILLILSVFADWIFGMLGEIRNSWHRHMTNRNE